MPDKIPVEGKRLLFLIDLANGVAYDKVVCLTTASMTLAANVITSASRCGTVKYNGDKNRTIQLDGFIVFSPVAGTQSSADLITAFENNTRFGWLFGPDPQISDDEWYTGVDALISNVQIGAPNEGAATFSATVELTGVPVFHQES